MLRQIGNLALSKLFGDGLSADLAARGAIYLADGLRESASRPDEHLTRVRLRPGETYTVIARPPATRKERRLAAHQRALRERNRRQSRPSRRQYRAARKLERVQVRLDRARPDTRRARRLLAAEERRGERFDRVMRPTRRQARTRAELAETTELLDAARAVSFERARAHRPRGRRRARTRVYD